MAGLVPIASLKGPEGPEGKPGKQGIPGVSAVPADQAVADYISGDETKVRESLKNFFNIDTRISGARMQSIFLGNAMRKLRKGENVKIVARGDSTTYGHDTVSADAVPAPTGKLPDGSVHSATRSPKPWPSVVQDRLNSVYAGTITVENQGRSGDYAKAGYDRWRTNVNADITMISYGINDASASYVPELYRGNVQLYVEWLEKMIIRDLEWGSAVVLLTSTKQLGSQGNLDTDTFRNAMYGLGAMYGVPIIDIEPMLASAKRDAWSDGNHLNTKGNNIFGSRLAAIFVGEGPQSPFHIQGGSKLLGRRTLDNMVLTAKGNVGSSEGFQTPNEDVEGGGPAIGYTAGNTEGEAIATFSFYVDEPDIVLAPIDYMQINSSSTGTIGFTYELDFGVQQGDNYHDQIVSEPANSGDQSLVGAPSSFTRTITNTDSTKSSSKFNRDARVMPEGDTLRITQPGWHTLRVIAKSDLTGTAGKVMRVHALEFISHRVYQSFSNHQRITKLENRAPGLLRAAVPTNYVYPAVEVVEQTTISWDELIASLGVPLWSGLYYRAPIIRLAVKTYNHGLIEYEFICTPSPNSSEPKTNIPAVSVGSPMVVETSRNIPMVTEISSRSLHSTGRPPTHHTQARELASIGLTADNMLVLNWRTTASGDPTQTKDLKVFSVITFKLVG